MKRFCFVFHDSSQPCVGGKWRQFLFASCDNPRSRVKYGNVSQLVCLDLVKISIW